MISYKYKLYRSKKTKHLENILREACYVWNHALALQKKYYELYKQYVPYNKMAKHFAKRYKRTYLHSQSLQEILERQDTAFKRFFKHIAKRPPKFKKFKDFSSFVYKQGGYTINGNEFIVNSCKKSYKFHKSRDISGTVKRVSVKRSHLNEYYIVVVTDANPNTYTKTHDGASVGMDFGLKSYLTLSDGSSISNPQYLKQSLHKVRKTSRDLSKKVRGSHNKERARLSYCRLQESLVHKRNDFQWKLAHELCRRYDYIFIEDLNLTGMIKLWGRKVTDLCHSEFISKLEYIASKYGVTVHKIDRFYPSSKLCDCGYVYSDLRLTERQWTCPQCGLVHNRDVHAACNILSEGIRSLESNRKTLTAPAVGQLR